MAQRRVRRPAMLAAIALVVLLVAGLGWVAVAGGWLDGSSTPTGRSSGSASPSQREVGAGAGSPSASLHRARPLHGRVVVLDPGHQLGNARFPAEINAPVDAGGFTKPCNTTGTSTNAGYPEATFTWQVAAGVRRLLEHQGARVLMTRDGNSEELWGPCVDVRGRAGNPGQPGPTADVKLSIHADGSYAAGAHGFHVIAPQSTGGAGAEIAKPSLRLARQVRDGLVAAGFATSTYTGSAGLDVRGDLGTLNLARMPSVMVECGNMRDPGDAATMSSPAGRHRYARALAAALVGYLTR